MNLVRLVARPMLGAIFVSSGVSELRKPGPYADTARTVTDRLVPTLRKVAPASVADRLPDDPAALVRLNAAVKIVGGLAVATNTFRRLGAFSLASTMVTQTAAAHRFWEEDEPMSRMNQRVHFLKNAAILGGLLLVSQDTEGQPSLGYRAVRGAEATKRKTRRAAKRAATESKRAGKLAKREAKHAAHDAKLNAKLAVKELPGT